VTDPLDDVLRALNAERYGPAPWWPTPPRDWADEAAVWRRRLLLQEIDDAENAQPIETEDTA